MTRNSAFAAAIILTCLACFSGGGCGRRTTVVYQEAPPPPPRTVVVYQQAPPPPPQQTVVYQQAPPQQTVVVYQQAPPPPPAVVWEDDEVNYVVYREYYGCSEEEVVVLPHYRRYYYLTDENIFFLFFVARHAHVPFDVVFHEYHDNCGRDYNRVVVAYRLDPVIFFVDVPRQTACPPIYARPYACYHNRQFAGVAFSGEEYHALIALKIGVEYQGHPPEVFFNHVRAGSPPTRVVYQNKEKCGNGRIACAGAPVRVVAHPWQMKPQERSDWRGGMEAKRTEHEPVFRQQHQEQIQSVQKTQANRHESPPIVKGHEGEHPREPGKVEPTPPIGKGHEGERPREPGRPETPAQVPPAHRPEAPPARPEGNPGTVNEPGHHAPPPPAKPGEANGNAPHEENGHKPGSAGEHPPGDPKEHNGQPADPHKPAGKEREKDHDKPKDDPKP